MYVISRNAAYFFCLYFGTIKERWKIEKKKERKRENGEEEEVE